MLLRGVFSSSADTVLSSIRKAFCGDSFSPPFIMNGITRFPSDDIAKILSTHGRNTAVTAEF